MLKTEVNTLVKKGIQSTMILEKHGFFKNQKRFNYKIVQRIVWGGVISQCCLHQAKGDGWFKVKSI